MTVKTICRIHLFSLLVIPISVSGQSIDTNNIKEIRVKKYPAQGLEWKGESAQNSCWNKITETPDGKVWYGFTER